MVQDNGDDKDGAKSKDSISSKNGHQNSYRFVVNHALVPGAYRTTPKRKTVPLADGLLAWQVTAAHSCSPWEVMSKLGKLFLVEVGLWLQGKKPFLLTRFARFVQDHRAISRYI